MGFEYVLAAINRDIAYREMIIKTAVKNGCDGLLSISCHRSEIAELEQIRANLEAIQGRDV